MSYKNYITFHSVHIVHIVHINKPIVRYRTNKLTRRAIYLQFTYGRLYIEYKIKHHSGISRDSTPSYQTKINNEKTSHDN